MIDNPVFSDATINLLDARSQSIFRKVNVSKLCLARRSEYFAKLFREKPEENEITIPMNQSQVIWMEMFLKFIYTDEPVMDIMTNLMVYEFGLQFDVPDLFRNFSVKSTEELTQLYNFIERQKGNVGVGLNQWKPRTWRAAEVFYQKAAEIINAKFRSLSDIAEHKKEYIALPLQAVKEILKNSSFQTDSENSIFTMIMIWINQNVKELKETERPTIREREIYLRDLLPLVDLTRLSRYYLLSIVSNVIEEIVNPEVKHFLIERYIKALELNLGKEQRKDIISEPIVDRVYTRENSKRNISGYYGDKFAMKVEYRRISEWKEGEKYYSQPIFSNGFLFYYFMRVEREKSKDTPMISPPFLAGYLRCTCDATIKSNDHYMPVSVTFEVALKNAKTRKFPPVSVVFDHFDRSIGSRMNQSSESWEKIRSGQSDIVNDDKIIVIIGVEFKNGVLEEKQKGFSNSKINLVGQSS
jgi:hypothetical protein